MDKLIPVVVIKELSETDKIMTALKNSNIIPAAQKQIQFP